MKRFSLSLTARQLAELRKLARATGASVAALVRLAVLEYLQRAKS